MEKTDYVIALIIDADNISYKYLETLFAELKNYGRIAYKRVYGDFTDNNKQNWATAIKENGLIPVQEYGCNKGKNTTDFAMVIDAMDILYEKYVDCFCIATSDSDFTRLVSRLKENNMFVIGAGESKSNKAYIKNYDRFFMLDQLYTIKEKDDKKKKSPQSSTQAKKGGANAGAKSEDTKVADKVIEDVLNDEGITPKEQIYDYVYDIIEHEESDDGWVYFATVMQKLYVQFPEFNVKLYKARNAREFFKMSDRFVLQQSNKRKANDSTLIRNKG